MQSNDLRRKNAIECRTDFLISEIFRVFPPVCPNRADVVATQPLGVDGYRMIDYFSGKPWTDLGLEQVRIPPEELIVNLSPVGFLCYLPQFLVSCLRIRQYGWIDDMLLPVGFGMDEVVRYFTMDDESLLDPSNFFYQVNHERVAYVKERLNKEQLACVANYVELANTDGYWDLLEDYCEPVGRILTDIEKDEKIFQQMMGRYVKFWRGN